MRCSEIAKTEQPFITNILQKILQIKNRKNNIKINLIKSNFCNFKKYHNKKLTKKQKAKNKYFTYWLKKVINKNWLKSKIFLSFYIIKIKNFYNIFCNIVVMLLLHNFNIKIFKKVLTNGRKYAKIIIEDKKSLANCDFARL